MSKLCRFVRCFTIYAVLKVGASDHDDNNFEDCPGIIQEAQNLFLNTSYVTVNCNKHALHIFSDGIPNHIHDSFSIRPQKHMFSIPMETQNNALRQNYLTRGCIYKMKTLGDGPIGFALNGVSTLSFWLLIIVFWSYELNNHNIWSVTYFRFRSCPP